MPIRLPFIGHLVFDLSAELDAVAHTKAQKIYDAMYHDDRSRIQHWVITERCPFNHDFKNEEGDTLFHMASIKGYREIMEALYDKSEEKEIQRKMYSTEKEPAKKFENMIYATDDQGYTALHHAAMRNSTPSTDPYTLDSYQTMEWILDKCKQDEKFEFINRKSKQGYTALDIIQAFMPIGSRNTELDRKKSLLEQYQAEVTNNPVKRESFIFPKFPNTIQELEWHSFPKNAPSSLASSQAATQTTAATEEAATEEYGSEATGEYYPEAYDAIETMEQNASRGYLKKSPASWDLNPSDDDEDDKVTTYSHKSGRSAWTTVSYPPTDAVPPIPGQYRGTDTPLEFEFSETDTPLEFESISRSPSPVTEADTQIFSSEAEPSCKTLQTPETSRPTLNTTPSFFETPRTPKRFQNELKNNDSGLPNNSENSCYPKTPRQGPFVTPPHQRVHSKGNIPKTYSAESNNSDATSISEDPYNNEVQSKPSISIR